MPQQLECQDTDDFISYYLSCAGFGESQANSTYSGGVEDVDTLDDMAPKLLNFRPKLRESDFPGIEISEIADELRLVYLNNKEQFSSFKDEYVSPENKVFYDFVEEFLFILRNKFELPEDPQRFRLIVEEVLSAPVLYNEYTALMDEVSTSRFGWGISDYAQMDIDGNGEISREEIEAKYGKSKKKIAKMLAKERTHDDHISLTEFIQCWDHVAKPKKEGKKGAAHKGRRNKGFTHKRKYQEFDFPGVGIDEIALELQEAYAANKDILDHFKEEYAAPGNGLFREFVEELIFVRRNVSNLIPTTEEQYTRLLEKFLTFYKPTSINEEEAIICRKPITYKEYCGILALIPVNKFGWGIDSFAKLDLDANGMITTDEIEAAFGKNSRKREKIESLEKNKDGKISLAEFLHCWEHDPQSKQMPYKVMMVLTNNSELGDTGRKTGFFLPEAAHPYTVFRDAGLKVIFVSPRGGKAPMDPMSYEMYKDDLVCASFLEDPEVQKALDNTTNPANIDPKDISCVFYVGGHGPMWDVTFNRQIADLSRIIYTEYNGIISGVDHGICGLVPITLKRATKPSILENAKVTCFSNKEEELIFGEKTWEIVNFKLEDKLKELGAEVSIAEQPFTSNIASHKRIITGQNQVSAVAVSEKIVEELAARIADKKALNTII